MRPTRFVFRGYLDRATAVVSVALYGSLSFWYSSFRWTTNPSSLHVNPSSEWLTHFLHVWEVQGSYLGQGSNYFYVSIFSFSAGSIYRDQTRQPVYCTYSVTLGHGHVNNCRSEKSVSITYSKCVFVTLSMQHAMSIHRIVICGLPALQYFSTLSHKRYDFRKKKRIEHEMCVLVLCTM